MGYIRVNMISFGLLLILTILNLILLLCFFYLKIVNTFLKNCIRCDNVLDLDWCTKCEEGYEIDEYGECVEIENSLLL